MDDEGQTMKYNDKRLVKIRRMLHEAVQLLERPESKSFNADLDRIAFEQAEDLMEKALNICHREVGDEDFNDGISGEG
jgi:hypothetical protein